jgi:hypothetical protein
METIIKVLTDSINYSLPNNPNNPNTKSNSVNNVKVAQNPNLNATAVRLVKPVPSVKPFNTLTGKPVNPVNKQSKVNLPLKHVKKLDLELEYESHRNLGLSDTGYYMDLSERPIGNRPVHKDYSKHKTNILLRDNYAAGNFSCKQPVWSENCF